MVVGTVAGVATIVAAAPAIAIAVGVGSVATATAGTTGAVAVAAAGGTATAVGGAGGITAAAATVGSVATGALETFAAPLATAGPWGWAVLGATEDRNWDCWKPVVHETCPQPSKGRLPREIVADERIKETRFDESGHLFLLNTWDELFCIDLVIVDGELAAHATMC